MGSFDHHSKSKGNKRSKKLNRVYADVQSGYGKERNGNQHFGDASADRREENALDIDRLSNRVNKARSPHATGAYDGASRKMKDLSNGGTRGHTSSSRSSSIGAE